MMPIFFPVLALVALTAIIWVLMYYRRLTEMWLKKISPQQLATVSQAADRLDNVSAAENFSNLLETPVLFYVLCLALYASESVTDTLVLLAWIYVALRVVHSLIHVTGNHVISRWMAYVVSTVNLFVMWGIFAMDLVMD